MPGQDQPLPRDTAVTGGGPAALDTALAYHRAWTGHDFERAMTYIAEDIVCQAPAGTLEGAEAFRGFMGPPRHLRGLAQAGASTLAGTHAPSQPVRGRPVNS